MCGIEDESRPLGPSCLYDDASPGLAPWAFESRRVATKPQIALWCGKSARAHMPVELPNDGQSPRLSKFSAVLG